LGLQLGLLVELLVLSMIVGILLLRIIKKS